MACKTCGSNSHTTNLHYDLRSSIKDKGYPTTAAGYKSAHSAADKAEKKKYPAGYEAMKKIDRELPKNELAGKNTKSGKVEVSAKVPQKLRRETAFHEKVESSKLRNKK